MRCRTPETLVALALVAAILSPGASAADASGTARVYGGTTDAGDASQNVLSQDYTFRVIQPITPWITFFAGYQSSTFEVDEEGGDFERRSREPVVELTYRNGGFSGRLGYRDRRTRGTTEAETLDIDSLYSQFAWKPARGPQYSLRVDRSSNVADVAVFGRDLDTTNLNFDVTYYRRNWNTRYSFEDFRLDNNLTGFTLDQQRHLVQATHERHFLEERLFLSTDWLVTRTVEEAGQGAFADPVPARAGLFAIDPSPGLGVLDPAPMLVDGDTSTPARDSSNNVIEIGGPTPSGTWGSTWNSPAR